MKLALAALVVALAAAAGTPVSAMQIAQVGKPAPQFAVTALDGKKLYLRQFAGRPVFINFFATWCPPCKHELPNIVKHYPAYKKHVVFLGLDQEETPEMVRLFLKRYSISYPIGIDEGQVGAAYGVADIPQSVFIDRRGIVRAIWRGYMPPNIFERNMALISR